MSLLSALLEAEKPVQRCFARQLVKIISVLSLGYTSVPEPLQFVEPMITLLSERMFEVSQPMLHLPIRTPCGMVRSSDRTRFKNPRDIARNGSSLRRVWC